MDRSWCWQLMYIGSDLWSGPIKSNQILGSTRRPVTSAGGVRRKWAASKCCKIHHPWAWARWCRWHAGRALVAGRATTEMIRRWTVVGFNQKPYKMLSWGGSLCPGRTSLVDFVVRSKHTTPNTIKCHDVISHGRKRSMMLWFPARVEQQTTQKNKWKFWKALEG